MLQLVLTATIGLSGLAVAKGAPPTDSAVIAALPPSDTPRDDVVIVKSLMSAHTVPGKGSAVVGQWTCSVYYAEGTPPRQRVHIVYIEAPAGR